MDGSGTRGSERLKIPRRTGLRRHQAELKVPHCETPANPNRSQTDRSERAGRDCSVGWSGNQRWRPIGCVDVRHGSGVSPRKSPRPRTSLDERGEDAGRDGGELRLIDEEGGNWRMLTPDPAQLGIRLSSRISG